MIILPPRSAVALIAWASFVAVVVLLVDPVAVGGLDEQIVGFIDHRRIREHGTTEASEIAAKEDGHSRGANSRV